MRRTSIMEVIEDLEFEDVGSAEMEVSPPGEANASPVVPCLRRHSLYLEPLEERLLPIARPVEPSGVQPPLTNGMSALTNGNQAKCADALDEEVVSVAGCVADDHYELYRPTEIPLAKGLQPMFPPKVDWLDGYPVPCIYSPPYGYGKVMDGWDALTWAFWWMIGTKTKTTVILMLLISVQGATTYFIPTLMAELFTSLNTTDGGHDKREFTTLAMIYTAVTLINSCMTWAVSWYTPVGGSFRPEMVEALTKHILMLPASSDRLFGRQDFVVMFESVNETEKALIHLIKIIQTLTQLVSFSIALSAFSSYMVMMQFGIYMIMLPIFVKTSYGVMELTRMLDDALEAFFHVLDELIATRVMLRHFVLTKFIKKQVEGPGTNLKFYFQARKIDILQQDLLMDVLANFGGMGLLLLGGSLVMAADMDVAELVTFYTFYSNVSSLVLILANSIGHVQNSSVFLNNLIRVLKTDRGLKFPEEKARLVGSISLKNVCFGYDILKADYDPEEPRERGPDVLQNVCVDIPAGSKVAVVGRGGGGKSSLLCMLSREFQPYEGEIKLGGKPLNCVDMEAHVAVCSQHPVLFDGDILANITLANPDISEEEVAKYCKKACVLGMPETSWIFPEGLRTECGVEGSSLSGGMKMRVSIARTIARNTPVMLFDEPLAAQDVTVRAKMTDQLVSLTHTVPSAVEGEPPEERPTTVVMITHTLNILHKFDYVLFMDNRTVADFGPINELMEARGPLWQFIFRSSLVCLDDYGKASLTNDGLRRLPMFSKLPDKMLQELCRKFTLREVKKGEVIFQQGEANDAMAIFASGNANEFVNLELTLADAATRPSTSVRNAKELDPPAEQSMEGGRKSPAERSRRFFSRSFEVMEGWMSPGRQKKNAQGLNQSGVGRGNMLRGSTNQDAPQTERLDLFRLSSLPLERESPMGSFRRQFTRERQEQHSPQSTPGDQRNSLEELNLYRRQESTGSFRRHKDMSSFRTRSMEREKSSMDKQIRRGSVDEGSFSGGSFFTGSSLRRMPSMTPSKELMRQTSVDDSILPGIPEAGRAHGKVVREVLVGDCLGYEALHHLLPKVQSGLDTYLFTSVATSKCSVLTIKYAELEDFLVANEQSLREMEETEARLVSLRMGALKSIWQFAKLDENDLKHLALHLEIEVPPTGNQFYRRADSKAGLYIVLMGSVTLSLGDASTGEQTETAMLKPGETFGMEQLVGGETAGSEVVLTATAVGSVFLLYMRPTLYDAFNDVRPIKIKSAIRSIVEAASERRQAAQLARVWLFTFLTQPQVVVLASKVTVGVYESEEVVINAQRRVAEVLVVVHGRLAVTMQTCTRVIIEDTVGPGAVLNELAALPCEGEKPFELLSIVAAERCVVLRVPVKALRDVAKLNLPTLSGGTPKQPEGLLIRSVETLFGKTIHRGSGSGRVEELAPLAKVWATKLSRANLSGALGVSNEDADILATCFVLQVRTVAMFETCDAFLCGDPRPLMAVVLQGQVEYAAAQDGQWQPLKGTDFLMNSTAAEVLTGRPGAARVPPSVTLCNGGIRGAQEALVVMAIANISKLEIDLEAASAVKKAHFAAEEVLRQEAAAAALTLQEKLVRLQRQLGWAAAYHGAAATWRVFVAKVLSIRRREGRPTVQEVGAEAEAAGEVAGVDNDYGEDDFPTASTMLRTMVLPDLQDQMVQMHRLYKRADHIYTLRKKELADLQGRWVERGMDKDEKDGESSPFSHRTLSARFLSNVRDEINKREKGVGTVTKRLRKEMDQLGDLLGMSHAAKAELVAQADAHADPQGFHRMRFLAEQCASMREDAYPVIRRLNQSVADLEAALHVPKEHYWPSLQHDKFELDAVYRAQQLINILTATVENVACKSKKDCDENVLLTAQLEESRKELAQLQVKESRKELSMALSSWHTMDHNDLEHMTDEEDVVLTAKTPAEEQVLWEKTEGMLSQLGIEGYTIEQVNLMAKPDPKKDSEMSARQVVLNKRRGRIQFLHLQEHCKLRTILDAYGSLLDGMNEAGITDKKSRDAMVASVVKVSPTAPGQVVEHFKQVQVVIENMETKAEIDTLLESIAVHATNLGDPSLMAAVRARAEESGIKSSTVDSLTQERTKLRGWLKLKAVTRQIIDLNAKLQADMDEAENFLFESENERGVVKTSIKEEAEARRDPLEQEEASLIEEYTRPPPTIISRPKNPKFYRKVSKSMTKILALGRFKIAKAKKSSQVSIGENSTVIDVANPNASFSSAVTKLTSTVSESRENKSLERARKT